MSLGLCPFSAVSTEEMHVQDPTGRLAFAPQSMPGMFQVQLIGVIVSLLRVYGSLMVSEFELEQILPQLGR